mgnify:CR=1 FL=1
MKVGVTLFAQNYLDWNRYEEVEADPSLEGTPQVVSDAQIYREQFHLGRLVEPLGNPSGSPRTVKDVDRVRAIRRYEHLELRQRQLRCRNDSLDIQDGAWPDVWPLHHVHREA